MLADLMLIHRLVYLKIQIMERNSKLTSITIADQHLIPKPSYGNQRSFGLIIDSDSEALT
ncbi:hypothetical protein DYY65_09635 [Nitrososphaera sp. AFS]|nr:hypothetical protein [Nitrososphaera sp. AFS]